MRVRGGRQGGRGRGRQQHQGRGCHQPQHQPRQSSPVPDQAEQHPGPSTSDGQQQQPLGQHDAGGFLENIQQAVDDARGQVEFLKTVKGKVDSKEYITIENPSKKRSSVWRSFKVVVDAGSKLPVGAHLCTACGHLLRAQYDGSTTTMKRHLQFRCGKGEFNTLNRPAPPPVAKEYAKNVAAGTCAEGLISFEALCNNEAMADLLQAMIDLGHAFGPLDVSEVMPSSTTVSDYIKTEAERIRQQETIPKFKAAVAAGACAATVDGWTEHMTSQPYLTLTIHFINDEWYLEMEYLLTIPFDEDEETGNADHLINL